MYYIIKKYKTILAVYYVYYKGNCHSVGRRVIVMKRTPKKKKRLEDGWVYFIFEIFIEIIFILPRLLIRIFKHG